MASPSLIFRPVQLPAGCKGRLFLTSMPGRYHDIQEALEAWNALKREVGRERLCLVSLVDEEEIRRRSPDYAKSVQAGLWEGQRISFPIPDFGLPSDEAAYKKLVEKLARDLKEGHQVVIHCAAGIGRTGMTAACTLTALGLTVGEAQKQVRAAGSGAETPEQIALITRLFR